jgi:hypothetical protein
MRMQGPGLGFKRSFMTEAGASGRRLRHEFWNGSKVQMTDQKTGPRLMRTIDENG